MKNGIQRQSNCFDGMDRVGLCNVYIAAVIISCFCIRYERSPQDEFLGF